MVGKSSTIKVTVLGDARQLKSALAGATRATESFGQKAKRIGTSMAKTVMLPLAGAVAFGVKSLVENERLMAQTQAAIKSTGGSAGVTAKQIKDMALSLSDMSSVAHEDILQMENVLLTFKNIKNQAGENNDIYDQSVKAILDMSVAMGMDAKSAAIQLGKALNDPAGQLGALSRVGITFTDSQRDMIRAMVEVGDVAGAQKVMLKELTDEFGGSAKALGETAAGDIGRLKNSFEAATRALAQGVLPVLQASVPAVQNFVAGLTTIGDTFTNLPAGVKLVTGALGGLTAALALVYANPVIAGLGLVVALIAKIGGEARERAGHVQSLADSFDSGAEAVRKFLIEQSGLFGEHELAGLKKAGISMSDIAKASLEGSDALDPLLARLRQSDDAFADWDVEMMQAGAALKDLQPIIDDANASLDEQHYQNALRWLNAVAGPGAQSDVEAMGAVFNATTEKVSIFSQQILDDLTSVADKLEAFRTAVDETADKLGSAFDPVPDQIKMSLDELGENMSDWLAKREEWRAGLKLLASRGMGDLAEVFREEGPTTLDVLNEALADPSKAAALNHTAGELADGFGGAFIDGLAEFLEANLEATLRDAAQQASVFVDVPTFTSSNSPAARRANVRNIDRQLADYHQERQ